MKRFAVILIIAVLALGCVFAASSSVNVNSGNKFIVKTKIPQVVPVYKLIGYNTTTLGDTGYVEATAAGANEIEGITSTENGNDYVSINVSLKHFGYTDNDTTKAKTNIKYRGTVKVDIEAGVLKNTYTKGTGTTSVDHVMESGAAVAGTWNGSTATNFKAETSGTANKVTVSAQYTTGRTVATGTDEVQIANGSFKWDITELTPGDTYKADVTITYTVE